MQQRYTIGRQACQLSCFARSCSIAINQRIAETGHRPVEFDPDSQRSKRNQASGKLPRAAIRVVMETVHNRQPPRGFEFSFGGSRKSYRIRAGRHPVECVSIDFDRAGFVIHRH